jgi:thioredoxin 1
MRTLFIALLLGIAGLVRAAPPAYDETADARAQIQEALAQAAPAKQAVLVVFGANWCGDCTVLDQSFKEGSTAVLIAKHFKVVKVNVGRFNRNTELAESYGVPLKAGIPAVAILSSQGQPTYATRAGELADARSLGDPGIHRFFAKVLADTK